MPSVNELVDGRGGSLASEDFAFFPYEIGSSGSGSSSSPGTTLRRLTPAELAEIQANGGGTLSTLPASGSSGSGDSVCSLGVGFVYSPTGRYTRRFQVISSPCETLLNARTARDASGVPVLGSPFPADPFSLAISKDVTSEPESPNVWYVTVEYSREGNPLLDPWQIDWDFTTFTVAAVKDRTGAGIVNAAGFPFDPPIEIENRRFTLSLTRNVATWSLSQAIDYSNAINDTAILIGNKNFAAKTLKCNAWKASAFEYLGQRYWRESLVIEYNPDTWVLKVANVGFLDRTGSPFTKDGWANNTPVPLDSDGDFLNPGDPIQFKDFEVYPEKDFCILHLNYGI